MNCLVINQKKTQIKKPGFSDRTLNVKSSKPGEFLMGQRACATRLVPSSRVWVVAARLQPEHGRRRCAAQRWLRTILLVVVHRRVWPVIRMHALGLRLSATIADLLTPIRIDLTPALRQRTSLESADSIRTLGTTETSGSNAAGGDDRTSDRAIRMAWAKLTDMDWLLSQSARTIVSIDNDSA